MPVNRSLERFVTGFDLVNLSYKRSNFVPTGLSDRDLAVNVFGEESMANLRDVAKGHYCGCADGGTRTRDPTLD